MAHADPSRTRRTSALRSRLVWRVAGLVFLTIAAIFSTFLAISYYVYRESLLDEIEARGLGYIDSARELGKTDQDQFLDHLARVSRGSNWEGAALIASVGVVGHAGRPPDLATECGTTTRRSAVRGDLSAYEVCWPPEVTGLGVALAARFDTSDVRERLVWYVVSVAGIGLAIAVATTALLVTLIGRGVLFPLLALREHMVAVAANPEACADAKLPAPNRRDEVGELLEASQDMFDHIAETLTQYRELQTSLESAKRRAEEADEMKTYFLASMSHELRTPLNAIIGFSDILNQEAFGPLGDDRYRAYAGDIRYAGEHLQTMINNILDISKIEAGRMDTRPEPVPLSKVLDPVTRMAEQRLAEKTVVFRPELSEPEPVVHADRVHLQQILINLLTNAGKVSPNGGVVRVTAAWRADGAVVVTVDDDGPGMDADTAAKALEPFQQVNTAGRHTHEGGTGLGLPLSRRLAEINGGHLELDSAPGRGTTVRVRMPGAGSADEATHGDLSAP